MKNGEVFALQMEALYKAAPASVLSIVGGLIALWVYWTPDLHFGLVVWFTLVTATALVHLASALLRHLRPDNGWSPTAWSRLVKAIYLSSGSCWGVGCGYMLLSGNEQQAIVACCLLMGAVTISFPAAVYAPAFQFFQVPALLLMAVALGLSGLEFGAILSAASVMMCVVIAIIAQGVGSQLVLALVLSRENQRLVERLEIANDELLVQSNTDPLTGVANRRGLMGFLRSAGGPFGLLVVDVDRFKSYNDSFGHAEGDECLKAVAAVLSAAVIPGRDFVARQGGEEFVVILGDRSQGDCHVEAEAIRRRIEALHEHGSPRLRRQVTASIGLAWTGPENRIRLPDLMRAADDALYAAKHAGRNRVQVHSQDVSGRRVA